MKKYRKKPVVIEAVRFENEDLTTLDELVRFLSNGWTVDVIAHILNHIEVC